ncbi:unnamed protein product [Closterium sp. Naga37s-1]|nr:unnamed protein product [Closterium sp. Naga37s-1]
MADEGERAKPKPFKAEYAKSARASCRNHARAVPPPLHLPPFSLPALNLIPPPLLNLHLILLFPDCAFYFSFRPFPSHSAHAPPIPPSPPPMCAEQLWFHASCVFKAPGFITKSVPPCPSCHQCSPAPLLPCSPARLLVCSSAPIPFTASVSAPSARFSLAPPPFNSTTYPLPSPPASVGDVEGADVLRWEDQQALRAYAKGELVAQAAGTAGGEGKAEKAGKAGKGGKGKAAAAAGAKGDGGKSEGKSEGKSKGKRGKAVADDSGSEGEEAAAGTVAGFQVTYAASNRSACRHCNEKIAKGEATIAMSVHPTPYFPAPTPPVLPIHALQLRVARMKASSRGMEVPAWRHAAWHQSFPSPQCPSALPLCESQLRVARMEASRGMEVPAWCHAAWHQSFPSPQCPSALPLCESQLRVARMEASRGMEVPAWRHVACMGEEGIWPEGARVQGVQGWGELQKEDQQRLLQLLGGGAKGTGKGGGECAVGGRVSGRGGARAGVGRASEGGSAAPAGYTGRRGQGEGQRRRCVYEPPKKRQRGAEQDGGGEEGSKSKGKGKEDAKPQDTGKSEEGKMSAELERALEQQARRVWEVKDQLRAHLTVADMRAMLEANQQEPGGSEDALRERCADGMLFGPLPPCQLCAYPMEYWDGRYRCRGFLSAWSACSFTTRDVQRKQAAWVVPEEITNPFVDEYRLKQQQRFNAADKGKGKGRAKGKGKGKAEGSEAGEEGASVWPQRVLPPEEKRSEVKQASTAGAGGKEASRGKGGRAAREGREAAIPDGGVEREKPLEGVHVALVGRLSRTQAAWRKEIEEGGGAVVSLTSAEVDCIVATEADVEKNEDKLLPPLVLGAAVVSEAYLLEALSQKRRLPMRAYLLPLSLQLLQQVDANRPAAAAGKQSRVGGKGKGRAGEGEEQVRATVRVKGRAAVHEASGLAERGHVLECQGCVWSTTLSLADLSTGANSYYILQVIEDDKSPTCHVFRKWGRVGNEGRGGSKLEQESRERAMGLFKRLFREKTGNDWDAWQKKSGFEKQPGKFYPLEIDYGGGDEEEEQGGALMGTRSKLDKRLVALLMMIFDLKSIREAMVEFEINVREMPLGKLTKRHIERGFHVLTDVQAALQLPPDSTGRRESAIVDASNRFFTLIPTVNPAAIRTLEALTTKIRMLEALRDMEVTSTLLSASKGAGEGEAGEKEDPVDRHYRQLQCGLSPLEHSDADYSLVKDYLHKTHAPTHKEWELELLDVFRVDRSGEKQAFRADIKNHMLLWHGSRVTNYVGILRQGLRIAPPEAPVTGYMFGKGVYFADLVSKSAQYCFTSRDSNVGLLLLSRVALGALYELTSAEYVEKLPRGKHATKGLGTMKPKEAEFVKWASDVVVPCGKPVPSGVKNSHLRYNEFIVYDTSQLAAVLQQLLLPDNDSRKAAEAAFKQLSKDPAVLLALLHFLKAGPAPDVRQLAAVLMRKKVAGLWAQQPAEAKASIKSALLESIALEPSPVVRRASADVASVIAKHSVPNGEWPELLPFLLQCSQGQQEDHRELAFILFAALVETIGDVLRPHFPALHGIFVAGLRDQASARVRVAALKAVAALVEYLDSEQDVALMRDLVAPMLDVGRFSAGSGDEAAVVRVCEVVTELAEHPAPVIAPSLPAVIQFALELASNTHLEPATRFQAAQVVAWCAAWKAKWLAKQKLVPVILAAMARLLAEPCGQTDSEQDEEYDLSPMRFAAQAIDAVAMEAPRKHVFPPVLAFARAHITDTNPHMRYAAVMALAVITEGCCEAVRGRLESDMLPLIVAGLGDAHPKVRGAACFAVGQLSEFVQPEASEHYKIILPAVFAALNDASPVVREKAYYALAAFCEHMGDEILDFLDPLMRQLMDALRSPDRNLQEMCISAIGSAAAAAGPKFAPYSDAVLAALIPLVSLTAEADVDVRSRAYELVGIIGIAVGRQAVEPVLPGFMDAALKGFALDQSALREYAHSFFSDVAKFLEADFAPYLQHVVPLAFSSCRLDDGIVVGPAATDDDAADAEGGGRRQLAAALAAGEISSDSEDEDEEGALRGLRGISVRTAVLDEKAAAAQAIGAYAQYTKAAFGPYVQEAVAVLKDGADYAHEDVRLQATLSLQHLVTAALHAFPSAPGQPMSAETKHVSDVAMEVWMGAMKDDEERAVVGQAFSCATETIKALLAADAANQPALLPYAEPLVAAVRAALRDELPCQRAASDAETGGEGAAGPTEAAEEEEEEEEHDEELMDAAVDLLPAVARAVGAAAFAPVFHTLLPDILAFTKASRPPNDRSMAVGCIADVAGELGEAMAPYVDTLLPVLASELKGGDPPNRRNAAFAVGKLAEVSGAAMHRHYPDILLGLHPLFSADEDDDVRDNATGAVARMIASGGAAMPLEQVLPVLVAALPLKSDLEEAKPVYGCLVALVAASHPQILAVVPQLVPVFAEVAVNGKIAPEASFLGQTLGLNAHTAIGSQKVDSTGVQLVAAAAVRAVRCSAAAAAEAVSAPPAVRPSAAELAQTVVELSAEGTLVTLAHGGAGNTLAHGGAGNTLAGDDQPLPATWPLTCHAFFAPDPEGRPIVLLADSSRAAANLADDAQACLHVQIELPGQQKPQVSLHGRLTKAHDGNTLVKLEAAWRRRFPDSEDDAGSSGGSASSALFLLDVDRVLVAPDADQEGEWISLEAYLNADADPLREVAAGIVADFNREHWQDLRRFPAAFAALPDLQVDDASLIWVDRLGFDLRVLARPAMPGAAAAADFPARVMDVRVSFAREVGEEREARSALTMMAQVAWERERSFGSPAVPTAAAAEASS